MPSLSDWKVPPNDQPRPADYAFDLEVLLPHRCSEPSAPETA